MTLPLFFSESVSGAGTLLDLNEATARHINQVLRMKRGERLYLTNGNGIKLTVSIKDQNKKGCTVYVEEEQKVPPPGPHLTIAISLLKNTSRFEWFLEKATEIGVSAVVPLLCVRTEKTHFRFERMQHIMVSAMLQSQQYWLPGLQMPVHYAEWVGKATCMHKLIAHCRDTDKKVISGLTGIQGDKMICIGPEGDFTADEIELALNNGFSPVSLGSTRLRTETAGMAAAVLLRIV